MRGRFLRGACYVEIGTAREYTVSAERDEAAGVWAATSDDVPGLVTEAATVEELEAKLRVMIPELLEANRALPDPIPGELVVHVVTHRRRRHAPSRRG